VIQLLDDQLLSQVLRGNAPPRRRADIYTTGYWYVRLCRAFLGASGRAGVLSTPFAFLPPAHRQRATHALMELPEDVGLVSLRRLGPLIGQLRRNYDLNILGMEVLSASIHLGADVFLSAPSPRLEEALRREGRRVELVR
jgi:hypothetical protein